MKGHVFSGIQPPGNIHIGNYLAEIRRWVELQDDYENLFCIVGLKAELAEIVIRELTPLQSRYQELTSDQSYINHLLNEGALRVRPLAERTLSLMKDRMGLG